jgi:hypothetical protein
MIFHPQFLSEGLLQSLECVGFRILFGNIDRTIQWGYSSYQIDVFRVACDFGWVQNSWENAELETFWEFIVHFVYCIAGQLSLWIDPTVPSTKRIIEQLLQKSFAVYEWSRIPRLHLLFCVHLQSKALICWFFLVLNHVGLQIDSSSQVRSRLPLHSQVIYELMAILLSYIAHSWRNKHFSSSLHEDSISTTHYTPHHYVPPSQEYPDSLTIGRSDLSFLLPSSRLSTSYL